MMTSQLIGILDCCFKGKYVNYIRNMETCYELCGIHWCTWVKTCLHVIIA